MGIVASGAEFLVSARSSGVSFERTLTIGRQNCFLETAPLLQLGFDERQAVEVAGEKYADALFHFLGASCIDSLDASAYEGATIVHDLNRPAPPRLRGQFSAVVEAGSLEHVFNVPEALRTCLEAVAPGGHFLAISPTNNEAGHGFYQFSPELWFRLLDEENGYRLERMLIREVHRSSPWYEIRDPAEVGSRVEFVTGGPAYLFLQARRVGDRAVLETMPQQSDYVARWQAGYRGELGPRLGPLRRVAADLRRRWYRQDSRAYRKMVRWNYRDHPDHFRPVSRL